MADDVSSGGAGEAEEEGEDVLFRELQTTSVYDSVQRAPPERHILTLSRAEAAYQPIASAIAAPDKPATQTPHAAHRSGRGTGKNWHVISLQKQAQAAIKAGDYSEARELLHEGLRCDEHDAYVWLALARLEARRGEPDVARRLFESASEACPSNVRLIHARAVFETKAGRRDAARELFGQAADLDPANAYVSHAWGLLEESVGNASAAAAIYAALVETKPQAAVCVAWAGLEARARPRLSPR